MPRHWWIAFLACSVLTGIEAYSQEPSPRSYRMGTQPFFMRPAPAPYPDWRFENLEDKDLLSIHLDEHMGIPWDHFQKNQAPPAIWDRRVRDLAQRARATGKVIYLSANPLDGFRRKRAGLVNENGVKNDNASPRDRHGCHPFADDEPSRAMREAYVRYSRYLIDLFQPAYFSPAVEINAYFSECPERKEALIQWYSQLHHDLKAVYPNLPVFPTIQMEHLYGMASDKAWCGGTKTPERLAACLDRHLKEAMRLPGDVTGISVYPVGWLYLSPTGIPWTSMFDKISQASARPIFIAETGWASVPIRQGYKYRTGGSCKSGWIIDPSTANDKVAGDYLRALLAVADRYPIEAVVWWLNRDYFDAPVAEACPCEGENDTCTTLGQLHRVMRGADTLFRSFGNMGLRHYDGTPKPALAIWQEALARPYQAGARRDPTSPVLAADSIPRVQRTAPVSAPGTELDTAMLNPSPADFRVPGSVVVLAPLPAGTVITVRPIIGRALGTWSTSGTEWRWDGSLPDGKNIRSGLYKIIPTTPSGETRTILLKIQ